MLPDERSVLRLLVILYIEDVDLNIKSTRDIEWLTRHPLH